MRDPERQRRVWSASGECDAAPHGGCAISPQFEGEDTEPRFALGAQQGDRIAEQIADTSERATVSVSCAADTTATASRPAEIAQTVHDFRNPLSTIALEVCALEDKLARYDRSDVRDGLARITHNVEFLDRMAQDLLDLSSLDADRLELQRKPTELRTLLERIIDRVVPPRDRGRVSLWAADPVTASIDDLKIERVVANLLQNALKYTPRGSSIVVQLGATSHVVRVSVDDVGPGMTPTEIEFIFDKFRRASTAGGHDGWGLGLYVSKRIVEAHGGRIGVTSMRGAGSQFFFDLPVT